MGGYLRFVLVKEVGDVGIECDPGAYSLGNLVS